MTVKADKIVQDSGGLHGEPGHNATGKHRRYSDEGQPTAETHPRQTVTTENRHCNILLPFA